MCLRADGETCTVGLAHSFISQTFAVAPESGSVLVGEGSLPTQVATSG